MKPILTGDDATEFKGQVVAFTFTGYGYYGQENQGWRSPLDVNLRFGIVSKYASRWNNDQWGHNLTRYKRPSEVSSNNALIDEFLKSADMKMRLATDNEVALIVNAIECGKCQLEYAAAG